MKEKTNIEVAIQHLQIAKNLLEAESLEEASHGKGRTNWGRVGSLNDFVKEIQQVLSSDQGESGLESYYKHYEKNRGEMSAPTGRKKA